MAGDERKIITLVLIKGTNFYVITYMSLSSLCCNIFSFHVESSLQNFKALFRTVFSTMTYQKDAEENIKRLFFIFFIEIASSAKFLAYM